MYFGISIVTSWFVSIVWHDRREFGSKPQARSSRSSSVSSISLSEARPSRTMTWQVVQAQLMSQACSIAMPFSSSASQIEVPRGALTVAPAGTSICEALLENGIKIEHACDMSCACTTCHVIVREGFNSLDEMDENEEDLLDRAWGLEPDSRLGCQAIVADVDLTIEIPKYTINHARENH